MNLTHKLYMYIIIILIVEKKYINKENQLEKNKKNCNYWPWQALIRTN